MYTRICILFGKYSCTVKLNPFSILTFRSLCVSTEHSSSRVLFYEITHVIHTHTHTSHHIYRFILSRILGYFGRCLVKDASILHTQFSIWNIFVIISSHLSIYMHIQNVLYAWAYHIDHHSVEYDWIAWRNFMFVTTTSIFQLPWFHLFQKSLRILEIGDIWLMENGYHSLSLSLQKTAPLYLYTEGTIVYKRMHARTSPFCWKLDTVAKRYK